MQTVVVTSVPDVFLEPKIEGIKYVVPDICDLLNCERMHFDSDLTSYILYMADHSDAIFLSGAVPEQVDEHYSSKVHQAFPAWTGSQYEFLNDEIDFTSNYIESEQMLRNAVELLKI